MVLNVERFKRYTLNEKLQSQSFQPIKIGKFLYIVVKESITLALGHTILSSLLPV